MPSPSRLHYFSCLWPDHLLLYIVCFLYTNLNLLQLEISLIDIKFDNLIIVVLPNIIKFLTEII